MGKVEREFEYGGQGKMWKKTLLPICRCENISRALPETSRNQTTSFIRSVRQLSSHTTQCLISDSKKSNVLQIAFKLNAKISQQI